MRRQDLPACHPRSLAETTRPGGHIPEMHVPGIAPTVTGRRCETAPLGAVEAAVRVPAESRRSAQPVGQLGKKFEAAPVRYCWNVRPDPSPPDPSPPRSRATTSRPSAPSSRPICRAPAAWPKGIDFTAQWQVVVRHSVLQEASGRAVIQTIHLVAFLTSRVYSF